MQHDTACTCGLGGIVDRLADRIGERIAATILQAIGPQPSPVATAPAKPLAHTLKTAAKKLNVCIETLRHQERDGLIRFVRMGRKVLVPQSEIDRILRGDSLREENRSVSGYQMSLNGKAGPISAH